MAFYIHIFQVDLFLLAAGQDVAEKLMECVERVIERYRIKLSQKDDATRDFSNGVEYDTSDLQHIVTRPAPNNMRKLKEAVSTITQHQGKLMDRKDFERAAGRVVFASGEVLANSILATTPNKETNMVCVIYEAAADTNFLVDMLDGRRLITLTEDPLAYFLGEQAFTCDASGGKENGGYGICYRGYLCRSISPEEARRAMACDGISISHLEMVSIALAITMRQK